MTSQHTTGGLIGPFKNIISVGDLVVMYQGFGQMTPIFVETGAILQNKHGAFHHDDLIGKKYGTKVVARTSQAQGKRRPGWMHVLQPTAELWSTCVLQRTQIVQPSDQAIIVSQLWLKGGSVVLESGTGSGIFTTALARVVAPLGHVHTFEFNEHRATVAGEEFIKNGLDTAVTVAHRDICGEGFPTELNATADAVFLDVPNPWLAILHAKNVLKRGGRICTYSPCIEQVQRSCEALQREGFYSIKTIEVRLRHFDVRETSFIQPKFQTKEDTISMFNAYTERRATAQARKIARDAATEAETAIAADNATHNADAAADTAAKKESDGNKDGSVLGKRSSSSSSSSSSSLSSSLSSLSSSSSSSSSSNSSSSSTNKKAKKDFHHTRKYTPKKEKDLLPTTSFVTACPVPLMRGHTAFLTFATCE